MSNVTLKVDHPDFPDDYEFGVSELGRVKNHGTLEVDDDALKTFEASRGMSIAQAFYGNAIVSVDGAGEWTPPKQDQQVEQTTPTAPPNEPPPNEQTPQEQPQPAETGEE